MLTQRPSISDGWKAVNLKPQHPDSHLPICLSAGRLSATLYIRSLGRCPPQNKHKSPFKAHLTDADWVVVVVTGFSTLTPTSLWNKGVGRSIGDRL